MNYLLNGVQKNGHPRCHMYIHPLPFLLPLSAYKVWVQELEHEEQLQILKLEKKGTTDWGQSYYQKEKWLKATEQVFQWFFLGTESCSVVAEKRLLVQQFKETLGSNTDALEMDTAA